METKEYHCALGEKVNLPRITGSITKGQMRSYEHLIDSKYICVREATEKTRGMLVKILGKMPVDPILIKSGEPFCKDDKNEAFTSDVYYSYRFPSVEELKEILGILQGNKELLDKFEEASMHVNPLSTFWVRDTVSKLLFMKKPQYYDATSQQVIPAGDSSDIHYRITVAYYYKTQISW